MASAQVTPSAKVILSSPTDWEPWYTLLKDKAITLQVWEFVDPDKDTPQPMRPEKPKVSDVKPGATDLADLVAENDRYFDLYKLALSNW
jgi:cytochrome oxidase Cu insertion factor (SCO1/SenC/PrrC family)